MSTETLNELLIEELKDLHHAEKQLVKALPKLANAAVNPKLKAGFQAHLKQTRGHVGRIERAFKLLGEPVRSKPCKAMKGLIEEGAEAIKENNPSLTRDAQLIGAAQRVEHYEIAAYGTVRTLAELLDEDQVAILMQATLDEEGDTDKQLTAVAQEVNTAALEEPGDE